MSALDDDVLGTELVTNLADIASGRRFLFNRNGYRLPLQVAEREAGLTDADIWGGFSMTDDEMIDLFDALQPLFASRLSDLSYGYVEGLYDGGELEAAILMGLGAAADENVVLPMELVVRAAPMYTAGGDRIRYMNAASKLAEVADRGQHD